MEAQSQISRSGIFPLPFAVLVWPQLKSCPRTPETDADTHRRHALLAEQDEPPPAAAKFRSDMQILQDQLADAEA